MNKISKQLLALRKSDFSNNYYYNYYVNTNITMDYVNC